MTENNSKCGLRISIFKYANICLGIILLFALGDLKEQPGNVSEIRRTVSTISAEQTNGYQSYYNQRFGFRIDYPSDFTRAAESVNDNNGAKFYSTDRSVVLTVYGLNNMHRENPEALYRTDLSVVKGTIAHNALNGNSYVISWIDKDMTFYRRVDAGLGCMNVFMFQCPVKQAVNYTAILDHINTSFKKGDLSEVY